MATLGQYTVFASKYSSLSDVLNCLEHICSPGEAPMIGLVNYKTNILLLALVNRQLTHGVVLQTLAPQPNQSW